jgi:hypothetical protein
MALPTEGGKMSVDVRAGVLPKSLLPTVSKYFSLTFRVPWNICGKISWSKSINENRLTAQLFGIFSPKVLSLLKS